MKFTKKLVGALLAVSIASASIMGCSSAADTDVVLTVGDEDVTLGVLNFYTSFLAAYYETYYMSYFGDSMWETELSEGVTYEEDVKNEVMTTFQEIVVVRQHAEELGVSLTDEEIAAIEVVAQEFFDANDEEVRSVVSGSLENAIEVLSLFELDNKCKAEIIKAVDTEVSDEEAAQKKATYVYAYLTTTDDEGNSVDMTDEEMAALEAELEDLIVQAEETGDLYTLATELGYNVLESTFDSEEEVLQEDLVVALDALAEGEFTDVVKTDSLYYVGQLTSEFDEEATESMKESIIAEREDALYTETVAAWVAEVEITVNESAWKSVEFTESGVTMYYEDTTTEEVTTEEVTTEEVTTETTSE